VKIVFLSFLSSLEQEFPFSHGWLRGLGTHGDGLSRSCGNGIQIANETALQPYFRACMFQFELADIALQHFANQILYFLYIHQRYLRLLTIAAQDSD
jgi:hypothetical protein